MNTYKLQDMRAAVYMIINSGTLGRTRLTLVTILQLCSHHYF